MDGKTYQEEALKTCSAQYNVDKVDDQLMHAAIGILTEGGELIDAIKKTVFYGKELDLVNIKEELGDLMWYVAIACDSLGTDIPTICETNINKLRARYPEKFTKDAALNRDLDKERRILEE